MARKWSNLNLPGALHFVTGNCINRLPVFTEPKCCLAFLHELKTLNQDWPAKLIAYVLMPDHFHLISNPHDGCIVEFCRDLKSKAAKAIVRSTRRFTFPENDEGH
jgi:REP element-mobilizing transposase RayT